MPLYVYQCQSCSGMVELLQKFEDPAPERCDDCGKRNTLEKQVAQTTFSLAGRGWERDGYIKQRLMNYIGSDEQAKDRGNWDGEKKKRLE